MNSTVTATPPASDLPDLRHSLLERSPVPMAELEGVGHVLRHVNPAFCRLIGKSKAALLGTPFADTVQEGDSCLALVERVYRTGEAETHTEPVHPELHPAYWSYALWPVLDATQRNGAGHRNDPVPPTDGGHERGVAALCGPSA